VERAREALAAEDAESLANAAHSMKSSSSNLGLDRVRDPAAAAEAAGRAGDLAEAGAQIERLAEAVDSELAALAAWLEERLPA
jgi:HPt (histidine-containing phosphotransfer) domain-containing protein